METKFIKYRLDQLNLARLYRVSDGYVFDNSDVEGGALVIGHSANAKYIIMGYLRGIGRNSNNEAVYEVINAIEDEPEITFVRNPKRVNGYELPLFAAKPSDKSVPSVGHIVGCNGEHATMDTDCGSVTVDVNSICELVPYFKETK